jgi:ribonuclease HI
MIIIFTDGASRGNPGKGGWGAIILQEDVVIEIGGKEENTTNNRMEMTSAIEALKNVEGDENIELFTDSAYLLNGATKWIYGWQKNNWQTKTKDPARLGSESVSGRDVLNKDLWMELLEVIEDKEIEWKRISGHSGVPANERCDIIATSFAGGKPIKLFHGKVGEYRVDLSVTRVESGKSKVESKNRKKMATYSYVSLVDGKIKVHKTWAECESRVKGKSGAKYKKSVSEEDEKMVIAEFKRLG